MPTTSTPTPTTDASAGRGSGPVTNASDPRGPLGYGTLSVLTNNGSGGFTNAATFSTDPGPNGRFRAAVFGDYGDVSARRDRPSLPLSGALFDDPGIDRWESRELGGHDYGGRSGADDLTQRVGA